MPLPCRFGDDEAVLTVLLDGGFVASTSVVLNDTNADRPNDQLQRSFVQFGDPEL